MYSQSVAEIYYKKSITDFDLNYNNDKSETKQINMQVTLAKKGGGGVGDGGVRGH